MRVTQLRKSRKWIIAGIPLAYCRWSGPYRTKREAEEGMREWGRALRNVGIRVTKERVEG